MEKITLKSFVHRLNPACTQAMEAAAGWCMSTGGYEIGVEHFLLKLLDNQERHDPVNDRDSVNDIALILSYFEVNVSQYIKNLQLALAQENKGNQGKPVFSKALIGLLEDAWLIASLEQEIEQIRSGTFLLAMLANPRRHGLSTYLDDIANISYDKLKNQFYQVVTGSRENNSLTTASANTSISSGQSRADGREALEKYCINFTQLARNGQIDPVFCRDAEIRQIIDILARRRKNNPICVGEAGVGKTAVVEGLALKLVEGEGPEVLKNVDIYSLDLMLLQAGASVKGEFENRLNCVINEIKSSLKPIILFIDEAHTLIGAGGLAGSGDAANLLKPALARGELRTIAATTWSEYKKTFEKDPALARRFQLVKLEEPTPEQATIILRGIRSSYEQSHGVYVRDDAIVAAAKLSARYINGRHLPDKAIDVLDTAAARVKIGINSKPEEIDTLEKDNLTLMREHDAINRDILAYIREDNGELADILQQVQDKQHQIDVLSSRWCKEQKLAKEILLLRQQMSLMGVPDSEQNEHTDIKSNTPACTQELREKIVEIKQHIDEIRGETPLVHYEVDPDLVGKVISDWTGIPLTKMIKNEVNSVLGFADNLSKRIKGQDHAIASIDKGIRAAKAGINNPDAPMGVFLLVGPSGVGKTETCYGVADLLFGGEHYLTSIHMSEFQEKHSVSRLIGSPPGYIGYGQGGMLTEAVRQRPYCVVLLDEVEKADLEVLNLFYQVFDKGVLSDSESQLVDFKNTIIFLTCNLASDIISQMCAEDPVPNTEDIITAIRPILSQHFKPALLARMQVIPFYSIATDTMKDIVKVKLSEIQQRLMQNHQISLNYDHELVAAIANRCIDLESGARNIDHIINGSLLPQLASHILGQLSDKNNFTTLQLSIGERDEFKLTFL